MYASEFKLPNLVVKKPSAANGKSRLTQSPPGRKLQLPPIVGNSSPFMEQLQIEAKAIPFHGKTIDYNVNQIYVAKPVTAKTKRQHTATPLSRIKSCKPFMRSPRRSVLYDSYEQFDLMCEGKSSFINSIKPTAVPTQQPKNIENRSDEWIVNCDNNMLSLSSASDCDYSPVPLLNLPTNINDYSNNEHCSIVNLNIILPHPKPNRCNHIERDERFDRSIKTSHQSKRDKESKKTSIINKMKFDFDSFTASSNANPFNGKYSNVTEESSIKKTTTTATRQSSPRKSQTMPIPIKIIDEVDVIQFSKRKILRDPLNLTPRRKIHGHSKIPVSKGHHCLLTERKKQQTDSSIDCSESSAIMGSHTVQFPPTESFANNVNTRAKTGRFRKCSEKGNDDGHWKQIPPPPTPSHLSMRQISSRMSRKQMNYSNGQERETPLSSCKMQPPTSYNSSAIPSLIVEGNMKYKMIEKTKQTDCKYRKSPKGRCHNNTSGNEANHSGENLINISSAKPIHKAIVKNDELSPREPLFVKKIRVNKYKTNEEFSYSDVSASEDDALKQKVVKLKGQEYGTIRKEKRKHSRIINNKRPKTTKRSRVPQ